MQQYRILFTLNSISSGVFMVESLTMAEAKRYFELGMMKRFEIQEMLGLGVSVYFDLDAAGKRFTASLVDARTKQDRRFKSWDGAISAVRQIGFRAQMVSGSR